MHTDLTDFISSARRPSTWSVIGSRPPHFYIDSKICMVDLTKTRLRRQKNKVGHKFAPLFHISTIGLGWGGAIITVVG